MKLPVFAGNSLVEFLSFAKELGKEEVADGNVLTIYGMEVPAPVECLKANCRTSCALRANGSYLRQATEGLVWVLIRISRFRCGACGGSVSRPFSFLVPYRRFTARLICMGLEQYGKASEATAEEPLGTSYRSISDDLTAYVDDEQMVENEEPEEKTGVPPAALVSKDRSSPVRSTVFAWVDFVCKKIESNVHQTEKEIVLSGMPPSILPKESKVKNVNAWKAGLLPKYIHQQQKPTELNRISYHLSLVRILIPIGKRVMEDLRAYFLEFAEKCFDLLSDTSMVLPIAQTFGHEN